MTTYRGSCHCGRVQFELDAKPTRLSRCNCSICAAKGALYIPGDEITALRIVAGESELTAYRFNTRTATHYFCRHCGIHPFHRPRMNPRGWVANVRCLIDFDIAALPVREFDGQHWEAAARALGWTGEKSGGGA